MKTSLNFTMLLPFTEVWAGFIMYVQPTKISCAFSPIRESFHLQSSGYTVHYRPTLVSSLSIPDTNGAEERVIVSDASSFQRLKCMQEWYLGWEKVSCLRRCPQFRREREVPLYSKLTVCLCVWYGIYSMYAPPPCLMKVWNISVTTTEEYPDLRPDHKRRGFKHRGISVSTVHHCSVL